MRKKKIITVIGVLAILLSMGACQAKEVTPYEAYRDTYRAQSFLEKNPEYITDEALLAEALEIVRNTEETLEDRLHAADLLCEAEYMKASEEEKISREDFLYVNSGQAAAEVFAEIANGSELWEALEASYSTKELMYAAAGHFTPETVLKLYEDRKNAGDLTEMYFESMIDLSLKRNVNNLYALAETMFDNGYFSSDSYSQALKVFVDGKDAVNTVDEGLEYIAFFAETAIPLLEEHYPDSYQMWRTRATDQETSYFTPGLRIALSEDAVDMSHVQTVDTGAPAAVPTGKMIAIIENGSKDEYPEAGTTPVLDGDFILNLPADRVPATLEEVEYVAVITSVYENVGEYVAEGSGASMNNPIYAIASYSHISVSDWQTGEPLGYYGTVESDAPSSVFVVNGNQAGREYAFAPYAKGQLLYQAVEAYL